MKTNRKISRKFVLPFRNSYAFRMSACYAGSRAKIFYKPARKAANISNHLAINALHCIFDISNHHFRVMQDEEVRTKRRYRKGLASAAILKL